VTVGACRCGRTTVSLLKSIGGVGASAARTTDAPIITEPITVDLMNAVKKVV
jgi:hypothetical protein